MQAEEWARQPSPSYTPAKSNQLRGVAVTNETARPSVQDPSDTEVRARGYLQWGDKVAERLTVCSASRFGTFEPRVVSDS